MKFLVLIQTFLTLYIPIVTHAAEQNYKPEFAREVWQTGDAMPEGIAFAGLLTHIMLHARDNNDVARGIVRTMFRTTEAEANELLALLLNTQKALARDERQDLDRLLCSSEKLQAEGQELYTAMDMLDETKVLNAERHLAIVRASLPSQYLELFNKRIAQKRRNGGVIMVDHAKRWENEPDRALLVRDEICQRLAAEMALLGE